MADAFVINALNKELFEQKREKVQVNTERGIEKDIRDILAERACKQLHDSGKTSSGNATDAFIAWLRAGIHGGEIQVNGKKSHVHVVKEGILLTRAIFHEFAKTHSQHGTGHEIYHQFKEGKTLHHGEEIHYHVHPHEKQPRAKSLSSNQFSDTHVSALEKTLRTGLVVHDFTALFDGRIPIVNPLLQPRVHSGLHPGILAAHAQAHAQQRNANKIKG